MNGGNGLDNIILRTEWFDETEKFCEIRLDCETKYLTIYQLCYIFEEEMSKVYIAMDEYIKNPHQTKKIIFGDDSEGVIHWRGVFFKILQIEKEKTRWSSLRGN